MGLVTKALIVRPRKKKRMRTGEKKNRIGSSLSQAVLLCAVAA